MFVASSKSQHQKQHARSMRGAAALQTRAIRPNVAYRQRGTVTGNRSLRFNAPETWHDPTETGSIRYIIHPAGAGYIHPVTVEEVRDRIAGLPAEFTRGIEVIQFSSMTRKRSLFPLYGMQWGPNVYLYPMQASLIETFRHPPTPVQWNEARMFGGIWSQSEREWHLKWTAKSIRDFYLNNVLIHEIGHVNDNRNTNMADRERFANWFATEYGYRVSRGRR